jgi:hypothetical protein
MTDSQEWKNLQAHFDAIKDVHMRDLFASDNSRFSKFTLKFGDILLDYSKNRITGLQTKKEKFSRILYIDNFSDLKFLSYS